MGFSSTLIRWILLFVTNMSYNVCFNGSSIGPITLKRGLCQDDPLLPYLIFLCVEGLSSSITNAANADRSYGGKISSSAPAVSHLLFTDDNFLFFKAIKEETLVVKSLLNSYEQLSGQSINFKKSGILFNANVRLDKQHEIKAILLFQNELSSSKYL